jgi:DNA gyrase subunit A
MKRDGSGIPLEKAVGGVGQAVTPADVPDAASGAAVGLVEPAAEDGSAPLET